jgi:hypothetical protein
MAKQLSKKLLTIPSEVAQYSESSQSNQMRSCRIASGKPAILM